MGTEAYGDQCCWVQSDPLPYILSGSTFPLLSPDPLGHGAFNLASGFRLSPVAHGGRLLSRVITSPSFHKLILLWKRRDSPLQSRKEGRGPHLGTFLFTQSHLSWL